MATLSQILDLVLGLVVVALTVAAYVAYRRRNYQWHAQLMTIGLSLIIASFLLVMLPALAMTYMTFNTPGAPVFDTASIVHIPLGIMGLGLGGWLMARWARNGYRLSNMKATWPMRITMATWIANVILGAAIFFTMPS